MTVGPIARLLVAVALARTEAPTGQPEDPELRRRVTAVALAQLDAVEAGGDEESVELARTALGLAGRDALPALVERLERGLAADGAPAAAWALGIVLAPQPEAPEAPSRRTRAVLLRALGAPDWDTRLAAASTLGVLGVAEASIPLGDLLFDPDLPARGEPVLWLALAGVGGPASSFLEGALWRGGGPAWAEAIVGAWLRRGAAGWPELLHAYRTSPDPSVRAAAATALLLLAEPEATCGLIEAQGREPDPALRRVAFQAIAAGRHPLGRDFLGLAARHEKDSELRRVASLLAGGALDATASRPRTSAGVRPVASLLAELARGKGLAHHLEEIEERARPVHLERIEAVLRVLPLRGDGRWRDDHARLAQTRARLLCLDGIDCRR